MRIADRRPELEQLYLQGLTYREIGARLDLAPNTVKQYVYYLGINKLPRVEQRTQLRQRREAELRALYAAGASNKRIAELTGYEERTVRGKLIGCALPPGAARRGRGNIPPMTAKELEAYDSLKHKRIPAQERYEIAIRSTR